MAIDITKCKRVRVRKPANVCEWPVWVQEMDKYDEKVITVESWGTCAKRAYFCGGGWQFAASWCEPADELAQPELQPAAAAPFVSPGDYHRYPIGAESGPGIPPPYGLLSEQQPKPRGLYRSAYCRRCGARAEWGCMCPREP